MDLFYLFVKVLYRSGPVGFIVLTLIGASLGHFDRNPQTAKDYVDRAQRHLIVNEFEEARANYNQAVKLNPSLAEAYTGRGELYLKQSRYLDRFNKNDEATRKVAQKLHLDLSQSLALKNAGIADYRKAQAIYQKQGKADYTRQMSRLIADAQQGKN